MLPNKSSNYEAELLCNICNSPIILFAKKKDRYYYKCKSCKHVFIPQGTIRNSSKKTIYEYEKDFFCNNLNEDYYLGEAAFISAKKKFRLVKKHIPIKGLRLLDVGSNYGHFLYTIKDYYDAEGLEISSQAVEYSRKQFGVNNHVGSIEQLGINFGNDFNIVTLWDVIEHLDSPQNALNQINKLLNKNGVLILSTPRLGSLISKILGRNWYHYNSLQHVNLFTSNNLRNLLNDYGFHVIKSGNIGHTYSMSYIIKKLASSFNVNIPIFDKIRKCKLKLYINLGDVMYFVAEKK